MTRMKLLLKNEMNFQQSLKQGDYNLSATNIPKIKNFIEE